jgi:uncharacterized membrane protein YfcA
VANPEVGLKPEMARGLAVPIGVVGGGLAGATSTAGPLITTYLHSLRMPRSSLIYMLSLTFAVFGLVQLVTLIILGAFTKERTVQALLAILPVLVMTPIGIRLGRRLDQRAFELIVLSLLGFAAVRLIISALQG